MVKHQGHLENILGFKEARQIQMDDHVCQMGVLTTLIGEVKSTTHTQTQRLAAQLDGLRSTIDTNDSTTKTDLIDIPGRIVPDLREHATTIALDVTRLKVRFDAFTSEFNAYNKNPCATPIVNDNIPIPVDSSPGRFANVDTTAMHCSNAS